MKRRKILKIFKYVNASDGDVFYRVRYNDGKATYGTYFEIIENERIDPKLLSLAE